MLAALSTLNSLVGINTALAGFGASGVNLTAFISLILQQQTVYTLSILGSRR